MTRDELLAALRTRGLSEEEAPYELLWQELRAIGSGGGIPRRLPDDAFEQGYTLRKREEIIAEMAKVCRANFERFARLPRAEERAALWLRRAVLHEAGEVRYIYRSDGNVRWRRLYEQGVLEERMAAMRAARKRHVS